VNNLILGASEDGETFNRFADSDVIYATLSRVMADGLAALLERLSAQHDDDKSRPEVLLLLARFLQAFPQLCGNVHTCLMASAHAATATSLETLFLDSSCRMFSRWSAQLLLSLDRQLGNSGGQFGSSRGQQQLDLLGFFPAWDRISVQVWSA
jgi:hypothetical protein